MKYKVIYINPENDDEIISNDIVTITDVNDVDSIFNLLKEQEIISNFADIEIEVNCGVIELYSYMCFSKDLVLKLVKESHVKRTGFELSHFNKTYFLVSDNKNITDKIAIKFVEQICKTRNFPEDVVRASVNSKEVIKYIKQDICKSTIEKREHKSGTEYYVLQGYRFCETIPENDFNSLIIFE